MSKYFKDIDYQLLDRKVAYSGKRLTIEELHYYNPRKQQKIYREHVLAGNAVIIVPITENNEFIMILEPRTPINRTVLAFPAGMIEEGESPEEAAIRELEEETGHLAKSTKQMISVYPTIGYSNEKVTIVMAKDLTETQTHFDETEDIEIVKIPVEQAKTMLDNNEFETASENVALLHYFAYEHKEEI